MGLCHTYIYILVPPLSMHAGCFWRFCQFFESWVAFDCCFFSSFFSVCWGQHLCRVCTNKFFSKTLILWWTWITLGIVLPHKEFLSLRVYWQNFDVLSTLQYTIKAKNPCECACSWTFTSWFWSRSILQAKLNDYHYLSVDFKFMVYRYDFKPAQIHVCSDHTRL